ncbi:MAG: hypothetical protein SH856_08265 [Flavobacteriales bacterium]|nr:hypothetical protein [Flavobacteriales bacterium]
MKTLAIALTIIATTLFSATTQAGETKDKDGLKKTTVLKNAIQKQINKYLFFPLTREENVEGTAEVMLQVYPGGQFKVVYMKAENALVRNFIERQVAKMKVDMEKVATFEVFRFRFEFKKQS